MKSGEIYFVLYNIYSVCVYEKYLEYIANLYKDIPYITSLGCYNSPPLKERNVFVATQQHVSRRLSGHNRDG